jgi:hypothetical protein
VFHATLLSHDYLCKPYGDVSGTKSEKCKRTCSGAFCFPRSKTYRAQCEGVRQASSSRLQLKRNRSLCTNRTSKQDRTVQCRNRCRHNRDMQFHPLVHALVISKTILQRSVTVAPSATIARKVSSRPLRMFPLFARLDTMNVRTLSTFLLRKPGRLMYIQRRENLGEIMGTDMSYGQFGVRL